MMNAEWKKFQGCLFRMSLFSIQHSSFSISLAFSISMVVSTAGCALFEGNPNQANIALRKQVQHLQSEITVLEAAHDADQRALAAWQQRSPAIPTLPPDRLAKLFTVHGFTFGRLTGGARLDLHDSFDDGLKVYVTPTDGTGQPLKASGSFVVEAFDLSGPQPNRVGRWTFTDEQAMQLWGGSFLENSFVLTCPFESTPKHSELTVKVEFSDELTLATFDSQTVVKLNIPPAGATQPSTTTSQP
jgi:hypothetical protein